MKQILIPFVFFSLTVIAAPLPESNALRFTAPTPYLPNSYQKGAGPSVALYDDLGVWDLGREQLKRFFITFQYDYRVVSAVEIQSGILRQGFRLLVMPGGESWNFLLKLGDIGAAEIKQFVARGGGYFGVCAGAFYATSIRIGGYKTGSYGIGLLEGASYDATALKIPPFIEGMMDFKLSPHSLTSGFQEKFKIAMFGGPALIYSDEEKIRKRIETLAIFEGTDQPAMITFQYGCGKVFLSAPHLEVEEADSTLAMQFNDPDSEWPLLHRMLGHLSAREQPQCL